MLLLTPPPFDYRTQCPNYRTNSPLPVDTLFPNLPTHLFNYPITTLILFLNPILQTHGVLIRITIDIMQLSIEIQCLPQ